MPNKNQKNKDAQRRLRELTLFFQTPTTTAMSTPEIWSDITTPPPITSTSTTTSEQFNSTPTTTSVKKITVKPGETLWGIAQRELGSGARWRELGGIPPQVLADPRKLQAGTVLTVPSASTPAFSISPTSTIIETKPEMKTESEIKTEPEMKIESETEFKPTTPLDLYDISKTKTDLNNAIREREKAYNELIGLQSSTYEAEYNKAGLGNLKAKVADIDAQINEEKRIRDESIDKVRRNPYYSAATITGEVAEIQRVANDRINRLIDQRNSIAAQYNSGIEDITRKVAYATKDAETKYAYWDSEVKRLSGLIKDYQTELRKQLEKAEEPPKVIGSESVGYWQWNPTTRKYDIQIIPPKAPEVKPGQTPTDIETYARQVLEGYPETSVPKEIRTEVMKRVEELRKTERAKTDEEIRAWIRFVLNSKDIKALGTEQKRQIVRDAILLDKELTEADKQRAYLILDEILPSEPAPKKRKSLWEWLGF